MVGLLPGSIWHGGGLTTSWGLDHQPNLPTEEVFTTPDPERVDGVVRSTRPRELDGTIVRDFEVRFESGRAVAISAAANAEVLQAYVDRDAGAARLGELALVDGAGRIGPLDTVFYDTLIDENAASHIALGQGFDWAVEEADRERINSSEIHVDFMIGSPEVDVTGLTAPASACRCCATAPGRSRRANGDTFGAAQAAPVRMRKIVAMTSAGSRSSSPPRFPPRRRSDV